MNDERTSKIRDALREILPGSEDKAEIIAKSCRECVVLFARAVKKELPLGHSRLGGGPDVPPGFAWPEEEGRARDFLMQINCEELHPHDGTGLFPKQGLLLIFDTTDWRSRSDCVFYIPDLTTLSRLPARNERRRHSIPVCEITMAACTLPPDACSVSGIALARSLGKLPEKVRPAVQFGDRVLQRPSNDPVFLLRTLRSSLSPKAPAGGVSMAQMGGHALCNAASGAEFEECLAYHDQLTGENLHSHDANNDLAMREQVRAQWEMLIEIYADTKLGLNWGDLFNLQLWMKTTDLNETDFTNVWSSPVP